MPGGSTKKECTGTEKKRTKGEVNKTNFGDHQLEPGDKGRGPPMGKLRTKNSMKEGGKRGDTGVMGAGK